jgi:hypothetical protein
MMPNDDEIVVRFRWTAEELVEGTKWHFRHGTRRFFRAALYALGLIFCLAGSFFLYQDELFLGTMVFTVGLYFLLARDVLKSWFIRRRFRTRPDQNADIEWRMSAERIRIAAPHRAADIEWPAFNKIVQTPTGFLFYSLPQLFHWLPRHGFANDHDFARLSQLAEERAAQFLKIAWCHKLPIEL